MIILLFLHAVVLPLAHACLATSPITMPVIPPCQECTAEYMDLTADGMGSKDFEIAVVFEFDDCAEIALKCVGKNANIEFNDMMGVVRDTDDGQEPGIVWVFLRCNADGTGWVFDDARDIPIYQAECAAG